MKPKDSHKCARKKSRWSLTSSRKFHKPYILQENVSILHTLFKKLERILHFHGLSYREPPPLLQKTNERKNLIEMFKEIQDLNSAFTRITSSCSDAYLRPLKNHVMVHISRFYFNPARQIWKTTAFKIPEVRRHQLVPFQFWGYRDPSPAFEFALFAHQAPPKLTFEMHP